MGSARFWRSSASACPGASAWIRFGDVQLLCPMNRGGLGARSLNLHLQQVLNPSPAASIEKFGWTFAVGDKVMQIENDYDKEVFNGDVGFVTGIDHDEGELVIDFDGREVAYGFGELDRVVLAYATTIHKAQGSEYPAIVIPVARQHYMMLRRNLLYTGVTRGKRLVILVGEKKAVAIAVKGVSGRQRWSKLREWLTVGSEPSRRARCAIGVIPALTPANRPSWRRRRLTVNRSDLVERLAAPFGLTIEESEAVLAAVLEEISRELASGGRVELRGFGAFTVREREARRGPQSEAGCGRGGSCQEGAAFQAGKADNFKALNDDPDTLCDASGAEGKAASLAG